MSDCIFCKIISNEIPSMSVYEDEDSLGFLEISPSAPGHTMVILKKHGRSIHEYTEQELGKILKSVEKVAAKIEKSLHTDSITIGINHLEKRGVPHLHIHLIPRWENDKGKFIQSIVNNVSSQSRQEIADKIKNA